MQSPPVGVPGLYVGVCIVCVYLCVGGGVCACMWCVCVHTCVRAYVRACARMYVHVCVCVCVFSVFHSVSMLACVCVHVYLVIP